MLKLAIKKHDQNMPDLQQHGDWIDLYFCGIHPKSPFLFYEWNKKDEGFEFFAEDYHVLSLGVSIQLPEGYEAHIVPRSSLFLKYGILQANSVGIIDNAYCGNNDIWGFPAYFTRPICLPLYTRIAQFRIIKKMPPIYIEYVKSLTTKNRGGFGESGNF